MSDHLNEDILHSATAMICENSEEPPADYLERAPFIIGQFYLQFEKLDERCRKAYGRQKDYAIGSVYAMLEQDFLFVPELVPAAIYYLASMLVMDENEMLGERLFDLFADAISTLEASLPFQKEKISQVY